MTVERRKTSTTTLIIALLFRSGPITNQPNGRVDNTFGVVSGERVLRSFECQEGCSSCGPRTITTLTDLRVITRQEQSAGCCRKIHFDSTLFLHDLAIMREVGATTNCLGACLSGQCLAMCCTFCGDRPKPLHLIASGTVETVKFKHEEALLAATEITGAAVAVKASKR